MGVLVILHCVLSDGMIGLSTVEAEPLQSSCIAKLHWVQQEFFAASMQNLKAYLSHLKQHSKVIIIQVSFTHM